MKAQPVVVVLAAGLGSRFAGPTHKLGQDFGGVSVLARVLRNVLATSLETVVVTTEALADEARTSVASRDIVLLPNVGSSALPLGMGYSIATGVSARPNASGWLVLPGDMPLVQPASVLAVAAAIEQHAIAFAQYQGRRGHPVGFSAELYSELSALQGDTGARRLIARYPAQGVDVDDAGVLVDIDTEADLKRARAAGEAALALAQAGDSRQ